MMHPVMGRGDQKIFEETQFVYFLRMHQDTPCLCSGINESDVDRLKTKPGNGNEIDETVQRFHHRGTETYCEVEFGGRVMRDMGGPEEPAVMIHPVQPVIHEILEDHEYDPVDPWVLQGLCYPVIIKEGEYKANVNYTKDQVNATVQYHEIDILGRVF